MLEPPRDAQEAFIRVGPNLEGISGLVSEGGGHGEAATPADMLLGYFLGLACEHRRTNSRLVHDARPPQTTYPLFSQRPNFKFFEQSAERSIECAGAGGAPSGFSRPCAFVSQQGERIHGRYQDDITKQWASRAAEAGPNLLSVAHIMQKVDVGRDHYPRVERGLGRGTHGVLSLFFPGLWRGNRKMAQKRGRKK